MKKCGKCKTEKPYDEFGKNKSRYDGYHSSCKKCRNKYQKEWYEKNKTLHKQRMKISKAKRREFFRNIILEYKLSHPCVDCGEDDPDVLEFDHISNDKSFNIGACARESIMSEQILVNEIAKCQVRCANCHRKITALRRRALVG